MTSFLRLFTHFYWIGFPVSVHLEFKQILRRTRTDFNTTSDYKINDFLSLKCDRFEILVRLLYSISWPSQTDRESGHTLTVPRTPVSYHTQAPSQNPKMGPRLIWTALVRAKRYFLIILKPIYYFQKPKNFRKLKILIVSFLLMSNKNKFACKKRRDQ